jgi:hypothetical protein
MTRRRILASASVAAVAVAAGSALAVSGALASTGSGATCTPTACFVPGSTNPIVLTPAQLLINQRIASAAISRSNTALSLLTPVRAASSGQISGWPSSAIANGAITQAKLAASLAARLPIFAAVGATGTLIRESDSTVQTASHPGTGGYLITFTKDITGCIWIAGIAQDASATPPAPGLTTVTAVTGNSKQVEVRTYNSAGTLTDAPFQLTVNCAS